MVIHGGEQRQAVFQPGDVIVRAVAGSDVDAARAGIERNEIRDDHPRGAVKKRMLGERADEFRPWKSVRLRLGFQFPRSGLRKGGNERLGNDERGQLAGLAMAEFLRDVAVLRVDRDAGIGRQGPGRGGPDGHARLSGQRA